MTIGVFEGVCYADASASAKADYSLEGERISVYVTGYVMGGQVNEVCNRLKNAYRKNGNYLQSDVDGQFSCLIVDHTTRRVLVTHDALGVKPIFIRHHQTQLEFSSRLTTLIHQSDQLDREYLSRYITHGTTGSRLTPFKEIRRLMPGESVVWDGRQAQYLRTWRPENIYSPCFDGDGRVFLDRFQRLVQEAVESATTPNSWLALSGGLDSTTIATALAESGQDFRAYSIISPRWEDADESRWIAATVKALDIDWHPIEASAVLPFSMFPECNTGEPTESITHCGLLKHLSDVVLSGDSGLGATVMTGKGGDTFMGGLPGEVPLHLSDFLLSRWSPAVLRKGFAEIREWKSKSKSARPWRFWLKYAVFNPLMQHALQSKVINVNHSVVPPWITEEVSSSWRLEKIRRTSDAPRTRFPGSQLLLDELWGGSSHTDLPIEIPYKQRHPFYTRALFEFLLSLPMQQKLIPGCDRYIQRRALKGKVPDSVRKRISLPTGSRAITEGLAASPEWVEFLCDDVRMSELGIANLEKWRSLIRAASLGHCADDRSLIIGVTLEYWLKQSNVKCLGFSS